jgi:hypothetical protein
MDVQVSSPTGRRCGRLGSLARDARRSGQALQGRAHSAAAFKPRGHQTPMSVREMYADGRSPARSSRWVEQESSELQAPPLLQQIDPVSAQGRSTRNRFRARFFASQIGGWSAQERRLVRLNRAALCQSVEAHAARQSDESNTACNSRPPARHDQLTLCNTFVIMRYHRGECQMLKTAVRRVGNSLGITLPRTVIDN